MGSFCAINSEIKYAVLKYFGGKFMLAPWIISHFPEHNVYIEPYGGAASVLLRKTPSLVEVYNDLDGELVNLFIVLQNRGKCKELIRRLKFSPYSRDIFYLSFKKNEDEIERAKNTIIRSHFNFHPAAFFSEDLNSRHKFHSGNHITANNEFYPNKNLAERFAKFIKTIYAISRRFRSVIIENADAMEIIKRNDSPDSLFFVDPPYSHETRNSKNIYKYEMDEKQHEELLELLCNIKGMAIISGYSCDLYNKKLQNFQLIQKKFYAMQHGTIQREESIWLSPRCAEKTAQTGLF